MDTRTEYCMWDRSDGRKNAVCLAYNALLVYFVMNEPVVSKIVQQESHGHRLDAECTDGRSKKPDERAQMRTRVGGGSGRIEFRRRDGDNLGARKAEAIVGDIRAGKILFLGNSITLHGPLADIGWTNNFGMAASSLDKDYVHILTHSISEITGVHPTTMVKNISDFERGYEDYNLSRLGEALDFGAEIVILAIGENVPALPSGESKIKFRESVLNLLEALKNAGDLTIIVRSSFWKDRTRDEILKEAGEAVGGIFVDIGALGMDESHYARSEGIYDNRGVGAHPGDKGMQAIADVLLAAIKSAASASNGDTTSEPDDSGERNKPRP